MYRKLGYVLTLLLLLVCELWGQAPVYRVEGGKEDFYVRDWIALGPFESKTVDTPEGMMRTGYSETLVAELVDEGTLELEPGASYRSAMNPSRSFECVQVNAGDSGRLSLSGVFGDMGNVSAYLFTWIESEVDQRLTFLWGSDDSAKVWINGEPVFERWVPGGRGLRNRSELFEADLRKGRNSVLVKVEQLGGGWGIVMEAPSREDVVELLTPRLSLHPEAIAIEGSGDSRWSVSLRAGLNLDETLFSELRQGLTVTDVRGDEIGSFSLRSGESTHLEMGAGSYLVRAQADGLPSLVGEAAFVVGETGEAYAQDQVAAGRRFVAANPDAGVAGWVSYLAEKAEKKLASGEAELRDAVFDATRIEEAITGWRSNERKFMRQRGVFEWAYLSKVDRSGQPFTLKVPQRYDSKESWPLLILMHGAGGSHSDRWGTPYNGDYIELKVDGRGPVGSYVGFSEVDVLEAIDYVQRYWNVDPDQVHLSGGSMGGYGTYFIGSRHPDRFATAAPLGGNGGHAPIENLINVPLYSIHSDDDFVVVVSGSRTAVQKINDYGGTAVLDETTGLGHAFGNYAEGMRRVREWREDKVRIPGDEVKRVVLTATDSYSRKAYWASIEKFGPIGKAARMDLRTDGANGLYAEIDNVAIARIDLAKAPVDREKDLRIVIGRGELHQLSAPLPERLYLSKKEESGWEVSERNPESPDYRYHFPGGMTALYHDEALLIVWGSLGNDESDERLRHLAEVGSRLSRPSWTEFNRTAWMPNGRIEVKRDVDVTSEDIESKNLILIGGAEENALSRRVAGALPVSVVEDGREVVCSDGQRWSLEGRGFGLLSYNPLAPKQLVYWIVGGDETFYRADSPFFRFHLQREPSPDFIVMDAKESEVVAARRFDSDWEWERGYEDSPLLESMTDGLSQARWEGSLISKRLGTPYAVVEKPDYDLNDTFFSPSIRFSKEARVADVLATKFEVPLGVITLSGKRLVVMIDSLAAAKDGDVELFPQPSVTEIDEGAQYRIGISNKLIRNLTRTLRWAPEECRLERVQLYDAILSESVL